MDDMEGMKNAILELDRDKELRERLGKNAYETIVAINNIDGLSSKMDEILLKFK